MNGIEIIKSYVKVRYVVGSKKVEQLWLLKIMDMYNVMLKNED